MICYSYYYYINWRNNRCNLGIGQPPHWSTPCKNTPDTIPIYYPPFEYSLNISHHSHMSFACCQAVTRSKTDTYEATNRMNRQYIAQQRLQSTKPNSAWGTKQYSTASQMTYTRTHDRSKATDR